MPKICVTAVCNCSKVNMLLFAVFSVVSSAAIVDRPSSLYLSVSLRTLLQLSENTLKSAFVKGVGHFDAKY